MKFKTKLIKGPTVTASEKADSLATAYYSAKEEEKIGAGKALEASAAIKELAESEGVTEGKNRLVKGRKYAVGYSVYTTSPTADLVAAKRMLSKEVLMAVTERVVNSAKLEEAVHQGLVTAKQLKAILIPGSPIKRLVITTKCD